MAMCFESCCGECIHRCVEYGACEGEWNIEFKCKH